MSRHSLPALPSRDTPFLDSPSPVVPCQPRSCLAASGLNLPSETRPDVPALPNLALTNRVWPLSTDRARLRHASLVLTSATGTYHPQPSYDASGLACVAVSCTAALAVSCDACRVFSLSRPVMPGPAVRIVPALSCHIEPRLVVSCQVSPA